MGIRDWFKSKEEGEPNEEGYVSIDANQESQPNASTKLKVRFYKFAEQQNGEQIIDMIKKNDTILLVNISKMRNDMNLLKEWTNKVKETCKGMQGDIVGLSKDLLLITPSTVELERSSLEQNTQTS